jgi:ubiquinone/menaquinone biosynthesis C-methylase UbiE
MARVESLITVRSAPETAATSAPDHMGAGPAANPGTVSPDALRRLARLTRRLKRRIATLLELSPGQRVLDVGCGTGADAAAVGGKLGPAGRAFGIDYDATMIRDARQAVAGRPSTPCLLVADAAAVPYRAACFDACYSERVFQHVARPSAVIAEMVRVTRPGGRIVIADTDWASLSIDAPDALVERRLVGFVAESLRNGYAGRQLRRLMRNGGIEDVQVELWPLAWTDYGQFCATSLSLLDMHRRAVDAGVVSRAELARLEQSLIDADRRGAFFASGTIVVAYGRCPGKPPAEHVLQEEP